MSDLETLDRRRLEMIAKANEMLSTAHDMGAEIARIKNVNADARWNPELGDELFIISGNGIITGEEYGNSPTQNQYIKMGMYAKTPEGAEKIVNRLAVNNALYQHAEAMNNGDNNNKHVYEVNLHEGKIRVSLCDSDINFGTSQFYSESDGFKAVHLIGEDAIIEAWSK